MIWTRCRLLNRLKGLPKRLSTVSFFNRLKLTWVENFSVSNAICFPSKISSSWKGIISTSLGIQNSESEWYTASWTAENIPVYLLAFCFTCCLSTVSGKWHEFDTFASAAIASSRRLYSLASASKRVRLDSIGWIGENGFGWNVSHDDNLNNVFKIPFFLKVQHILASLVPIGCLWKNGLLRGAVGEFNIADVDWGSSYWFW